VKLLTVLYKASMMPAFKNPSAKVQPFVFPKDLAILITKLQYFQMSVFPI